MGERSTSPLILPAIIWIAGLLCGFFLQINLQLNHFICFIIPCFIIISALFYIVRSSSFKILLLTLLIFQIALLRSNMLSLFPENHLSQLFSINERITGEIKMRITGEPQLREYLYGRSYRIQGELISIDEYPAKGKILLSFPESHLVTGDNDLYRGNIIGTVAELTPYQYTRGFSRIPKPYFTNRSIEAAVARARTPVYISPVSDKTTSLLFGFRVQTANLRRQLSARIDSRFNLPEKYHDFRRDGNLKTSNSSFVKAVLLGDREEIGEMRDLLAEGGMSHLIAISGLHLAIISLIIMTVFKILRIRRTPASLLLVLFLITYGELCYWSPSVSRAVVMISLLMICRILQRKPSYNNILAAALIIITTIAPLQIFSIGMQFSFISVFVLINILPLFDPVFKKLFLSDKKALFSFFTYRLAQILVTTLFITLFLIPLNLYYFNQFSLNGLIGNLLGILLLGLILPLSVVVILLPPVPFLISIFSLSFNFLLFIFNNWTEFAASLPLFLNFIPFSFYQVLLAYTILGASVLMLKDIFVVKVSGINDFPGSTYTNKRKLSPSRTFKLYSPVLSLLFLMLFISFLIQKENRLIITLFHVGHGDLFLIETPDNERIMIDTGPPEEDGIHFRQAALPYLKQQGINSLLWLIITHQHNDHYGGLPYLAKNLKIENLMITEHFYHDPVWLELQDYVNKEETILHVVSDTTHIPLKNLKCKILHPDASFSSDKANEMSIVLKLTYRDFSILFTGDAEINSELHLLAHYPHYLNSRFLKVAHHGSRTSTSPRFVETVDPCFAFIPTARYSRFNFPHPETLKTLDYLGDYLFISAYDGTLQIKTDGITASMRTMVSERRVSAVFK